MGSPHFCSAFSQLYNFGSNGNDGINNEVQMPNLDISMQQVDSVVNVNGSGFSMNSQVMRENFVDPLRDGISPFPYQSHINYYQSGFRATIHDIIPHQQLTSPMVSRKRSITQSQMDFDSPTPYSSSKMIGYYEFKEKEDQPLPQVSKKLKKSSGKLIHHHEVNYDMSIWSKESKVQVKRSQKLGDKITALQKLVSPYGKTDTASVLQEACLCIKLLQEQIKNLFQMLSSSYHSVTALNLQEMVGEKQEDLGSKGLCLVPMSFTNQSTMEELFNSHHASSRKSHNNVPISRQYSAIFLP